MTTRSSDLTFLRASDQFLPRHIGSNDADIRAMLGELGVDSLAALMDQTVPAPIRIENPLALGKPRCETEVLTELRNMARQNLVFRSLIGCGYSDCIVPGVIQRNILENPGWYTQYTPYQAEIAQGRLEALINFQTMIADLSGLPLANASLLDEATAVAEAMTMAHRLQKDARNQFLIADNCHPQTIAVAQTRAKPQGLEVRIVRPEAMDPTSKDVCAIFLQYPATDGRVVDYSELTRRARDAGVIVVVACDLLALTLLRPPGELGADIAVGSAQRFGVPMGFGGPHAAFIAARSEHARQMPGRVIGVSKDRAGKPAYRLSIQTREQHIRRDKATSNICTAQALLANMASMYAVYHGPDGLRRIARRVHGLTMVLAEGLRRLGFNPGDSPFFDTLRIPVESGTKQAILDRARENRYNLRVYSEAALGVSLDETSSMRDVAMVWEFFAGKPAPFTPEKLAAELDYGIAAPLARTSEFLTHPIFNSFHSEHEMLRYLHRLQNRDLSLTQSMIPLGSCTMKLNATSEMLPVTWPEFGQLHPFAPASQTRGYQAMFRQLEQWLAEITGFSSVSLQPNSGAQGEYAGLLAIRAYHESRAEGHRNICLIPISAHGTNPASAALAGCEVVVVACDERGNIDLADLKAKAAEHAPKLAALMITYPSTHGVFETAVKDICATVHQHGGQVYMDGANMNAQVGLCRPGDIGADVCHLNLHKTFCIPHGGGGPGMGPIAVAEHLAPFLPGHPLVNCGGDEAIGPVSAAPWGSASILPISWMYIAMMGADGLTKASQVAILNANYMAKRLEGHYSIVYTGANRRVAHEFILDLREFKKTAGIEPDDVAKRLMDFGFHAPTMSFPVVGTLMIEPTESESKAELDRFCDAMIRIREEIRAIESGGMSRDNNPLKNAPHTAADLASETWDRPYSRDQAVFPAAWVRERKFWPVVGRIDNVYGDRHLFCTCPPLSPDAG